MAEAEINIDNIIQRLLEGRKGVKKEINTWLELTIYVHNVFTLIAPSPWISAREDGPDDGI